MRFFTVIIITWFSLISSPSIQANQPPPWFNKTHDEQATIRVDFFLTTTCPYCQKADAFFHTVEKQYPWLDIHRYYIDKNIEALEYFSTRQHQLGVVHSGVPAFFFCKTHWAGFGSPQTTGKELLRALDYCHQQILKKGDINSTSTALLKEWSQSSQIRINTNEGHFSIPLTLSLMAMMDAANQCALFGLMIFLSFLWFFLDDAKTKFRIGLLFIILWGGMHYISNSFPIAYFSIIAYLRVPAFLLGAALVWYLYKHVQTLKSVKPSLNTPSTYLMFILTTIMVFVYQQRCPLNIGFVYHAWISQYPLTPVQKSVYRLIYEFIYVLPLVLLLLLHLMVKKPRPLFKNTALIILFIIGMFLMIYPVGLSLFWLSCVLVFISFILGRVLCS